ncbi:MAG: hypothetical protein NVSMB26_28000 [Beijerinckiaceae bacterium]
MSNFFTDVILKSPWAHNAGGVCRDPHMLEPGTRAKVEAFIAEAKALGHDLRIAETYRSQARQSELFHEHKTQLSKVGCHGYGVAADFALYINGNKYDPRGEDYMFFQALCVKHKLISGIGWALRTPSIHLPITTTCRTCRSFAKPICLPAAGTRRRITTRSKT